MEIKLQCIYVKMFNCSQYCKESGYNVKSAFSFNLNVLYIARFTSIVGDSLFMVALSIIMAKIGAWALTILWVIKLVAPTLVSFIAGSITDRIDKKKVLIICDIIRAVIILLIPYVLENFLLVFLLIFFIYCIDPFFSAAINPVITSLTTTENRHKVNSIRNSIASIGYFLGPLIGALFVLESDTMPFYFQGGTYLISAILLLGISIPSITTLNERKLELSYKDKVKGAVKTISEDITYSLGYISKQSIIKFMVLADCFYLAGSVAIDTYEVVFLNEVLDISYSEYGIIVSYSGISFLLAGIINTYIANKVSINKLFYFGLSLSVLSYILFATAPHKIVIYISLFILGFGYTTFTSAMNTLIQTVVDVEKQGRIMSFVDLIPQIFIVISIGIAVASMEIFSIRATFVSLAVVTTMALLVSLPLLSSKNIVAITNEKENNV